MDKKIKEIEERYNAMKPKTIDNWVPLQDWWKDIQTLLSYIKELEKTALTVAIEVDRKEKVFMNIVNKKSEQAGELMAVNDLLKQAEAKIKELEEGFEMHKFGWNEALKKVKEFEVRGH